jgi:hypothetical protein
MAGDPIKLGSAAGGRLVFERGSRITTSESGIQSCAVNALCPDGQNVFNFIPVAGANFNNVFGTSYLPATFKVDYTGGGADIEYLEGKAARITINFKRPDPNRVQGRTGAKISVDSTLNYKSILDQWQQPAIQASDGTKPSMFGFPEPIVTVKYTSATPPPIGGGLTGLYAKPGTTNAAGFPTLNETDVQMDFSLPSGSTITYFNGTAFVNMGPIAAATLFHFVMVFLPNPLGWQLEKLKWDPQADASFYDVEESWRGSYFFAGVRLQSHVP